MFRASFVLILYFDWLLGPHKGQNFEEKKEHSFCGGSFCFMSWCLKFFVLLVPYVCFHIFS